ncbi:MAG: C40 family peptidase [Ferruginibacter sp.]
MNKKTFIFPALLVFFFCYCTTGNKNDESSVVFYDTPVFNHPATEKKLRDSLTVITPDPVNPDVSNNSRENIVRFAESLLGVPYKYASTDPSQGFDCSGFITYVFNHFKIKVPRSSVDFTNVGKEISLRSAKRGDLILFTGTDSTVRIVGHMGIITSTADTLKFVHSSSGRVYGVTETPLNKYYEGRFVKVIDIF